MSSMFLRIPAPLILFSSLSVSQLSTVSGTVLDSVSREPLVGATVALAGTSVGTFTDESGRFLFHRLEAGEYALRFTFIGYGLSDRSVFVSPGDSVHLRFC